MEASLREVKGLVNLKPIFLSWLLNSFHRRTFALCLGGLALSHSSKPPL